MKTFFFFISLILCILLLSGCSTPPETSANGKDNNSTIEKTQSIANLRASYKIPSGVFEELPAIPKDFNKVAELFSKNSLPGEFVSEEYYLQPEFYPSFAQSGLSYWTNPDSKTYGVGGVGFFPSQISASVKKGNQKVLRIFVHAGFGVQNFQGVKVIPEIQQGVEGIKATVKEPEFLLGPSFPKFSRAWAFPVDLTVQVPEGYSGNNEFQISLKIASPNEEKSKEWALQNQGKYFETAKAGAGIECTVKVSVFP